MIGADFLAGPAGGGGGILPPINGGPATSGADSYGQAQFDYYAPFSFGGSGEGIGDRGSSSTWIWPVVAVILVGLLAWKK